MKTGRLLQARQTILRQPIIIHYHIFKNAGSSIDAALERHFGRYWGTVEGKDAHDILSSDTVTRYLLRHPRLRALSSHLGRPPLPSRHCLPIAFLRHPLLRAKSIYSFVQHDESQPQHAEAQAYSFADFINHYCNDNSQRAQVLNNYQVFHLAAEPFKADGTRTTLTEAHFRATCARIRRWGFIGLVERFQDSLNTYNNRYRQHFPTLDLKAFHENRTAESPRADFKARIAKLEHDLGPALTERFKQHNLFDYALYDWAEKRFFA